MFNFKKDKEYIILLKTNKTLRIIVTKVVKLPDESLDVQSKDCLSNWDFNFNNEKLNCLEIIEPVNNSELFSNYKEDIGSTSLYEMCSKLMIKIPIKKLENKQQYSVKFNNEFFDIDE